MSGSDKVFLINSTSSKRNKDIELEFEKKDLFEDKEIIGVGGLNKKDKSISIAIVFLILFLGEVGRGIIIPTANTYADQIDGGGDAQLLGMIISGFSLGRFIATVALGFVSSNENYKKIFSGSIVLCIIGSIWYSLSYLDNDRMYIGEFSIVTSRFITGFGAGTLSVGRSFITEVTDMGERTTWMSLSSAIQFLGFAISPIVGSFLAFIPYILIGKLRIDSITAPGWLFVIINIFTLIWIFVSFKNPKSIPTPTSAINIDETGCLDNDATGVGLTTVTAGESGVGGTKLISSGSDNIYKIIFKNKRAMANLIIFTLLNFFIRAVLGIYECLGTPLYNQLKGGDGSSADSIFDSSSTSSSDGFNSENAGSGYWFGLLGFIGIFGLLIVSYFSKKGMLHDYWIFVFGNALIAIGCFVTMVHKLTWHRYVIGYINIWGIGFPLSQTVVISIFSKVLSNTIGNASQGPLIGIITASGSLGRVIGPLLSGLLYNTDDQLPIFGFAFVLSMFVLIVSILMIPTDIVKIKYLNYSPEDGEDIKYTQNRPLLMYDEDDDEDMI